MKKITLFDDKKIFQNLFCQKLFCHFVMPKKQEQQEELCKYCRILKSIEINGFAQYVKEIIRNRHPKAFYQKVTRKNFAKFTGKHPCLSLFLNKV